MSEINDVRPGSRTINQLPLVEQLTGDHKLIIQSPNGVTNSVTLNDILGILSGDVSIGISDVRYNHIQSEPSEVWTIVHNLDKTPSVSVIDEDGWLVQPNIQYVNLNTVALHFSVACTGMASLN